MQSDLVIRNAKIVLGAEVITGSLAVEDGAISAIDLSHTTGGVDFGGGGQEFGVGVPEGSKGGTPCGTCCCVMEPSGDGFRPDARLGCAARAMDGIRSQHRHYPYWCEGTVSTRRRIEPSASTPA